MAGAVVMPWNSIPGLHYDPTLGDIEAPTDAYVFALFSIKF